MVVDLRAIDEKEMVLSWAIAELDSDAQQKHLEKFLLHQIRDKIKKGNYDFSELEWDKLKEALWASRWYLVHELPAKEIQWYEGSLPEQELKDLKMIRFFAEPLGSNKLSDLVRRYQSDNLPLDLSDFRKDLQLLLKVLILERMKGVPIILGLTKEPPYILAEGYKRSCAMLLNIQEGKSCGGDIKVILGVSQQLPKWNHYTALS